MTSPRSESKTKRDRVECAFVALSYAIGRRGENLVTGLHKPGTAALDLAAELGHRDKRKRARSLAAELIRVVRALDGGRLSCP